ncbi:MAG: helix-turn-helix transcriptional regulator [Victivallales bacterium]|nr:helix-turn-helix transcriptional regulator [Victivallales bacterium]
MDKSALTANSSRLHVELFKVNVAKLWKYWRNARFTRTFWCLYWNDRPGAGLIMDGTSFPLTDENLYLLPPNPQYGTYCESEEVSQFFCQFYLPGFYTPEKLIPIPLSSPLKELLDIALKAWQSMEDGYFFPALSLIAMAIHSSRATNRLLPVNDPQMEQVRREMVRCLGSALNMPNLAQRFHLTEKALNARFQAVFGCTPYHYLSLLRYERAALMLRSSQDTIEDIGENVGYPDRNYFTRWFTRHAGMPPATYRRRYQSSADALPSP